MNDNKTTRPPLAVVGVSALFPGSITSGGFWSDILAGNDLLSEIPDSHWLIEDYYDPDPTAPDKTYANRGGFLEDIDFDAMGWGIPPNIIPATDTSQLLALIVAEQVLRDAARDQFDAIDRSRISCILGVTSAQELLATMVSRLQRPVWVKSLREHGLGEDDVQEISNRIGDHYQPWQESSFPGLLGNVVAGRIANRLDLGGTNCVTDAACASTFSAVQMAAQELYLGDSDLVITGGVDTLNDIFMYMCFSKTPALSPTGDCRPFSDKADGTMLGEGLGMVALRRLDDAVRDGNRIYAVLKGIGSGSDGRSKSVYAPVSEGQARALGRAYQHAGYSPSTVELLEAHGTGTKAGDVAEFNGLRLVFEDGEQVSTDKKQWCAIGSVKSQIGHTKAAAGAAGLFKAVMGLHQRVLPPTLKVDALNPKLNIEDSPFYVNTTSRPWVRGTDHPRRASVSAFGFGGSNFHLTLEEYNGSERAERLRGLPYEFLAIGGDSGADVVATAKDYLRRAGDRATLQRLAWESHRDFSAASNARLAVVASSLDELVKKLDRAAGIIEKSPDSAFEMPDGTAYGVGERGGDVAFLFPGQGSQYVGMGADVAMSFDAAIEAWDRAADVDFDGEQLHRVVFPAPRFTDEAREADEARLRQTEWAQPGIGVASLASLELMRALGVKPSALAGHSFGEVTALHAAGVLSEADMLKVARKRGELMADAAELPGAMSAVSATIDVVESVLADLGDSNVVIANHNAPDQVVISGTVEAVDAAEKAFAERGVNVKSLAVSTAFHSPVVADSAKPFGEFLGDIEFADASTDVYAGELAQTYSGTAEERRGVLARQIANPVRFVDTIEALWDRGVRTFVEVGPGSVLTKLVSSILDGRDFTAVSTDRRSKHGLEAFYRGLAGLAASGVELDLLNALWAGYGEPENIEAKPKAKLSVPINGANYQKVYPPKGGAAELPAPNPPKVEQPAPVSSGVSERELEEVRAQAFAEGRQLGREEASTTPNQSNEQSQQPVSQQPVSRPTNPQSGQPIQPNGQSHSPQWLATWREAHQQNAMSLMAFQHAMAQSQSSFMQAIQTSFAQLGGGDAPQPASQQFQPQQQQFGQQQFEQPFAQQQFEQPFAQQQFSPQSVADQSTAPQPAAPDSGKGAPHAAPATNQSEQQPVAPTPEASPTRPTEVTEPSNPPTNPLADAAPAVDLHALMLEAVADKTGYPAEMLELGMDLEGDLGIDSIKRVEILAAVQEQAPGMPDVDTNVMGSLKTLGEIVDYMQSLMPEDNGQSANNSANGQSTNGQSTTNSASTASTPAVDLHGLMLAAVADKTGYPAEMLELEMDLEGDLGIDSIKRVEILAAVQEQAPGMPDVDTNVMGSLKTLGEIVDYMQSLMPEDNGQSANNSADGQSTANSASTTSTPAVDLHGLMLAAVADKTGYPAEMLELDMDLEGDLGIDSIKRVEILAAVQEEAPGMPDVDTNVMGSLKTLGEIVDYMQSLMPQDNNESTNQPGNEQPTANTGSSAATPAVDLHGLMLEAVADKTGYPAEMLELDMDLEGDLGIDSIKRVEILAAVQEQAPGMPDVDTNVMGSLKTLGEIVEYMQSLMPGGSADDSAQPEPTTEATTDEQRSTQTTPDLGRFALELVPTKSSGLAMPGLLGQEVVVVGSRFVEDVVRELRNAGVQARTANDATGADAVIHLGGLAQIATEEDALEINRETFKLARQLADQSPRLFVTVQDTGGRFGTTEFAPERAYLAGLPGLVKTAAQEWPEATFKAIDIEVGARESSDVARRIATELLAGGGDLEVGLTADGERFVTRSVHVPVEAGEQPVGPDDVIVVSGGAKGVTASCVVEWARRTGAKFVLLGRSELSDEPAFCAGAATDADLKMAFLNEARRTGETVKPADLGRRANRVLSSREIRETLLAVETAGGQAMYVSADVTDSAAIRAGLERARNEWGPITGLVHGAGVLADKYIAEMSDDDFDFVFDTKVGGLRALLGAIDEELKVLCLFSSVSARCGNNGQANYSMANEVLNKVAAARAHNGDAVIKSLGWGPWEGGMVSPELKAHFERLGVPMIPLEKGAEMFADEMASAQSSQVELVLGGEPQPAALLGGQARKLTLEINVSRDSHSYLAGHSIEGAPVVPVVLVLEWFSRIASAYRRDLCLSAIKELKMLKGIRLDGFEGAGDRFVLTCEPVKNGSELTLQTELHGADGTPHYRARVHTARNRPDAAHVTLSPQQFEAWGNNVVYGDVLFHTDDFQVITDVEGVSDDGISGDLKGVRDADWTWDAWQTDVAAMDGGLQMLLLWAREKLGGAALPVGIGEFWSSSDQAEGAVKCVAQCRTSSANKATADVVFVDKAGDRLAEMRGVELILRPNTPPSKRV